MLDSVTSELTLFSKTGGKQVSSIKGEFVSLFFYNHVFLIFKLHLIRSSRALWDFSVLFFDPTDLPDTPVDLIINCLDCHENTFLMDQPWYRAAADWANQNRAPVLSLDPPASGQRQAVEAKWSLSLCLPLPLTEGAGSVYLCDIGIPRQVFQEVGIKYHSPFGCKFVIPLHSAWWNSWSTRLSLTLRHRLGFWGLTVFSRISGVFQFIHYLFDPISMWTGHFLFLVKDCLFLHRQILTVTDFSSSVNAFVFLYSNVVGTFFFQKYGFSVKVKTSFKFNRTIYISPHSKAIWCKRVLHCVTQASVIWVHSSRWDNTNLTKCILVLTLLFSTHVTDVLLRKKFVIKVHHAEPSHCAGVE